MVLFTVTEMVIGMALIRLHRRLKQHRGEREKCVTSVGGAGDEFLNLGGTFKGITLDGDKNSSPFVRCYQCKLEVVSPIAPTWDFLGRTRCNKGKFFL